MGHKLEIIGITKEDAETREEIGLVLFSFGYEKADSLQLTIAKELQTAIISLGNILSIEARISETNPTQKETTKNVHSETTQA